MVAASVDHLNAPADIDSELVERARRMAPKLRERALQTDASRTLPRETIDDLRDAGFFRLTTPAKYGGYEASYETMLDIAIELGKACGSTSWTFAVLSGGNHFLVHGTEQAQDEVFNGKVEPIVANTLAPTGSAVPAPGGYRLNGNWAYTSGINHANWVMCGAMMWDEPNDRPDIFFFLIPKSDYAVRDEWHTVGLRGSGSNTVVLENVFVPEYRRIPFSHFREGKPTPLHAAPIYRLPFFAISPIAMPAIGVALGAVEWWAETNKTRMAVSGKMVAEHVPTQLRLAESAVEVNCAELLIRTNISKAMRAVEAGLHIPAEERALHNRNSSFAVNLCVRAVERLILGHGASALLESSPIQRMWRDLHAMGAHIANRWDTAGEHWGSVALGQPIGNPFFF